MSSHYDLEDWKRAVRDYTKQYVASLKHPEIQDIVDYILLPGGSLHRSALVYSLMSDCGASKADGCQWACGLEMLHSSTLIHDDLPAIDNDDMRRGKASTHIVFGEAKAILIGDFLFSEGIRLISRYTLVGSDKTVELVERTTDMFSRVCVGQIIDVSASAQDLESLLSMYELKTGALFSVASMMGVLLGLFNEGSQAESKPEIISCAAEFGNIFGVAFQLRDDFRDSAAVKGRGQGSDLRNNKLTSANIGELKEQILVTVSKRLYGALVRLEGCCNAHSFSRTRDLIEEMFPWLAMPQVRRRS